MASLSAATIALISNAYAQTTPSGNWVGSATYQGAALPIEVSFEDDTAAGGVRGFFTSPLQKAFRYPLRNVVMNGSRVSFDLSSDIGSFAFSGEIAGASLIGTWSLFGVDAAVSMRRSSVDAPPYTRQPVTCRNADVVLSGTVLAPSEEGTHPGLVFVHGSGPETRDASNFFADLFAREGFVSLIFDKRGAGSSTGNWQDADFSNLAGDALACVDVLKARSDVVPTNIGLMGGSQAGWVAPLAASMSRNIAFLVLTSGPTVPVWREGWWDTEVRLRESSVSADDTAKALAILRLNDAVTRTGRGVEQLQDAIEQARGSAWLSALPFKQAAPPESAFRRFYRRIIDFDPRPLLAQLTIPSLWVYGGRDAEQPTRESAAILQGLRARGMDVTVSVFDEADHALFVGPRPGQAFRWPQLVPGYVDTLTRWLRAQRDRVTP